MGNNPNRKKIRKDDPNRSWRPWEHSDEAVSPLAKEWKGNSGNPNAYLQEAARRSLIDENEINKVKANERSTYKYYQSQLRRKNAREEFKALSNTNIPARAKNEPEDAYREYVRRLGAKGTTDVKSTRGFEGTRTGDRAGAGFDKYDERTGKRIQDPIVSMANLKPEAQFAKRQLRNKQAADLSPANYFGVPKSFATMREQEEYRIKEAQKRIDALYEPTVQPETDDDWYNSEAQVNAYFNGKQGQGNIRDKETLLQHEIFTAKQRIEKINEEEALHNHRVKYNRFRLEKDFGKPIDVTNALEQAKSDYKFADDAIAILGEFNKNAEGQRGEYVRGLINAREKARARVGELESLNGGNGKTSTDYWPSRDGDNPLIFDVTSPASIAYRMSNTDNDAGEKISADYRRYRYMSKDEREILNYLVNTGRKEDAEQYLKGIDGELFMRMRDAKNVIEKKYAEENPALATGSTFIKNLYSAAGTPLRVLATLLGTDKNSSIYDVSRDSAIIRQTVGSEIDDAVAKANGGKQIVIPLINKPIGSFMYGAITSVGDSALSMGVGKILGSERAISLIMGSSAASSDIAASLDRGMTPLQATIHGLSTGIIEEFTEKYSVEAFLDFRGGLLQYIAKNVITESSEEAFGSVLQLISDRLISAENNEINVRIHELLENPNMTPEMAHKQAWIEWAQEFGADTVAGGVSGGMFGAAGSANIAHNNAQIGNKVRAHNAQGSLVSFAKALPEGSYAAKLANKYGDKQLSKREVNKLGGAALQDLQYEVEHAQTAIERKKAIDRLNEFETVIETEYKAAPNESKHAEDTKDVEDAEVKTVPETEETNETMPDTLAHEYGLAGLRFEDLKNVYGEDAEIEGLRADYDAGKAEAKQRAQERAAAILKKGRENGRIGTLRSISTEEAQANGVDVVTGMTPKVRAASVALRRLAEATGINIKLYSSPMNEYGEHTGRNGWYDNKEKTVYLDVNAGEGSQEAIMHAASHELTHFIEKNAPDYYENEYKRMVLEALYEKDPEAVHRMVQEQIEIAKQNGIELTESQAMAEVIADASETMLFGDEGVINRLANENPTLFKRIRSWIDEFVKNLKRAYDLARGNSEAAKMLESTYMTFRQIQSKWWKGLEKASDNVRGEQHVPESRFTAYDKAHKNTQEGKNKKYGTALSTMVRSADGGNGGVNPFARSVPKDMAKNTPEKSIKAGKSGVAFTDANDEIKFSYAFVDANDLITSNNADGTVNENYPKELQPRDRGRVASDVQVLEISRHLNPARLAESADVMTGAPIIGEDLVVESGNGRVMAIRQAFVEKRGHGAKYTAWMKENADKFGFTANDVTDTSILVRVRKNSVDRASFTKKSNESSVSAMSETENAVSDASKLTIALMRKFNPDYDFDSVSNSAFITGFLEHVIPKSERGAYITADGTLSQRGIIRVRNALFQYAYQDANMTAQLSEETEGVIKNIIKSMTNIAPSVAVMQSQIEAGELIDVGVENVIVEAYNSVVGVRHRAQAEGAAFNLNAYLHQMSFNRESTSARLLMEMYESNKHSAKKMTQALNSVMQMAVQYGNPNQVTMFSRSKPSVETVVRNGILDAKENKGVVFEDMTADMGGFNPTGINNILELNKRLTEEAGQQTMLPVKAEQKAEDKKSETEEHDNAKDETGLVEAIPAGEGTGELLADVPAEAVRELEAVGGTDGRADGSLGVSGRGTGGLGTAGVQRVRSEGSDEARVLLPGTGVRGGRGTVHAGVNNTQAEASENAKAESKGSKAPSKKPEKASGADTSNGKTDSKAENKAKETTEADAKKAEEERKKVTTEVVHAVDKHVEHKKAEGKTESNFRIPESGLDLPRGEKSRARANIDAIRLVKQLEADGRTATEEEKQILSKYVGWGGLSKVFSEEGRVPPEWQAEHDAVKSLLTEDEYKAAARSTLTSFYTDIPVIRAMYNVLDKWGFKGGRILEPSCGVGNFIGAAPSFSVPTRFTGVELDDITSLIAKHLYPQSSIIHSGFENTNIPDGYYDIAIGNVPFGDFSVTDKSFIGKGFITSKIHNYFFAKALKKVRDGGIVMFITSDNTMDGYYNQRLREYMDDNADFLGAVRLPTSAFKSNAGTEVVSDILVFQKRPKGAESKSVPFINVERSTDKDGCINEYFASNPQNILGTYTYTQSYRGDVVIAPKGQNLQAEIEKALGGISVTIPPRVSALKTDPVLAAHEARKAQRNAKNGNIEVHDGKIYRNNSGVLDDITDTYKTKDAAGRVAGIVSIRNTRAMLIAAQQSGDTELSAKLRKTLNMQYDAFMEKYGWLNSRANVNMLSGDPDRFSVLALENYTPANKKEGVKEAAEKADIFFKDTVLPVRQITSAENVLEAEAISMNMFGRIDVPKMAELLKTTEADVIQQLEEADLAFKDEDGNYIPAEIYLTGSVRKKLETARQMASIDKSYERNVKALEKVIPEDVPISDVRISLGSAWIPNEVYAGFISKILSDGRISSHRVMREPFTSMYTIDGNSWRNADMQARNEEWSAGGLGFVEIMERIMNNQSLAVYETTAGSRRLNRDATEAVRLKAEKIEEAFEAYVKKNGEVSQKMERLYNDTFNDIVERKINGDALVINGMSADIQLKPHQKNVIHRAVTLGGNLLIAHGGGAGKTAEMSGIAMKLRELGIVKKPIFAVPKSVCEQWGREFLKFFPAARVLVPAADDFTAKGRQIFINNAAHNDYDAIIMSYEMFEHIPLSNQTQVQFLNKQIHEMRQEVNEAREQSGAYKPRTVKEIQKQIISLEKRVEKLLEAKRDDNNITFEEAGFDGLFVDEAHNFKNLQVISRLKNIGGINTGNTAKRTFDMLSKVQYLQQFNGGRGIVFATATPVMNTMGELYVMQKFLDPKTLANKNISTFDAWVKQFGRVTDELQMNAAGNKYEIKHVLSRFINLPELQSMFRSFADVMPRVKDLPIPKMKGESGEEKPIIHNVKPTEEQSTFMTDIQKRVDIIKSNPTIAMKGGDSMLKVTSDGRKVSYSMRMIDPSFDIEVDGKIAEAANTIAAIWEREKAQKGTQLVFMDWGVPGSEADLYTEMKKLLVKNGIPANEIASVYEADKPEKMKTLFEKVNDGDIRVLIGSTAKMGVGVNVQRRVAAMHHIDVPWRPGDLTQRVGRGLRQGNIYKDLGGVENHYYVTEKTFDTYMWQKIETKARFIEQVMMGTNSERESEGEGMELTAAEVTAIASGDPEIREKFILEKEVERLAALKRQHIADKHARAANIDKLSKKGMFNARNVRDIEADLANGAYKRPKEGFSMKVDGKTYTERKEAGKALLAAYNRKILKEKDIHNAIAEIAGFKIVANFMNTLDISNHAHYNIEFNAQSETGVITRIENLLESIPSKLADAQRIAQEESEHLEALKAVKDTAFEQESELKEKQARLDELVKKLQASPEERSANIADADEAVDADINDDILQYSLRRLSSDNFLRNNADIEGRYNDARALVDGYDERQNSLRDGKTSREMLADALETQATSNFDKNTIAIYKKRLDAIEKDVKELASVNRDLREIYTSKGTRDMERLNTLKNRKEILQSRIARKDGALLRIESTQAFRDLLAHEKAKAKAEMRKRVTARLEKYSTGLKAKGVKGRIFQNVAKLVEWLTHPTKKGYIPQSLKGPIGNFLMSLNLQSKRALNGGAPTKADTQLLNDMKDLALALSDIRRRQNAQDGTVDPFEDMYADIDLPTGFVEDIRELTERVENYINQESASIDFVVNRMSPAELEKLDSILTTLIHSVRNMNQFVSDTNAQQVSEVSEKDIVLLDGMKRRNARTGFIYKFLNWSNIDPVRAFDRLYDGGKYVFNAMKKGQDKMAKTVKQIIDFSESTFSGKESREWGKQVHTITLDGKQVQVTAPQLMELYALNRRQQARGHIYGGGIRFAEFKVGAKNYSDSVHVTTEAEIDAALSLLTPRQIEVAEKLQGFMANEGGKLGNEVTMRRFGTELFGGENGTYYPITSVPENIDANMGDRQGNPLYRLLNMGMTKPLTKNANNAIIVGNMFDTFSSHMSDMAQYNAFALPILDAMKWYNYRAGEKDVKTGQKVVRSVRQSIRGAYGNAANSYLFKFFADINGSRGGIQSDGDTLALKALHKINRTAVAANLRVALLQPTAIVRAAMHIKPRYLVAGATKFLTHAKRTLQEMESTSGIAAWKHLGFFDVNVSRGLGEMIKRDSGIGDKLTEASLAFPEFMDRITWGSMWEAAKMQALAESKGAFQKNSAEHLKAAQDIFDDTIYRTQVVDSMLTRSEFMRGTTATARAMSSFMSEPVKSYNMLVSMIHGFNDDVARGLTRTQAWSKHGKRIARFIGVYAASILVQSVVEAIMGAYRDEDDYESFMEKLDKAFKLQLVDNAFPVRIPGVATAWEAAKYYYGKATKNRDVYGFLDEEILTQAITDIGDGAMALISLLNGEASEKKPAYGYVHKALQAASTITGHPLANATREIVNFWNQTVAVNEPTLKIYRYRESDSTGVQRLVDALKSGDLEKEKRYGALLERKGVKKNVIWKGVSAYAKKGVANKEITYDRARTLISKYSTSTNKDSQTSQYRTIRDWERNGNKQEGERDVTAYQDLFEKIETGMGVKYAMDELLDPMKYGYLKKNVKSQITSHFKPLFIEAMRKHDRVNAARIKARVLTALELLGYDRERENKNIDKNWVE